MKTDNALPAIVFNRIRYFYPNIYHGLNIIVDCGIFRKKYGQRDKQAEDVEEIRRNGKDQGFVHQP